MTFDGQATANRAELIAWIRRSAAAVAAYFDGFPVRRVRLTLDLRPGHGVGPGRAHGGAVPSIEVEVGADSTRADLDADWVLVHELIHLGFPSVDRRHHWMEEGLATYVEPVVRARAGTISPEAAWADLVDGLPKGLPGPTDGGLDSTPSWGRTYWGGAGFWLMADIELRRRSAGRVGLEQALRAVVRSGGTIGRPWPALEVIRVADEATGSTVLKELYDSMALAPGRPELEGLWRSLGVDRRGSEVSLRPSAEWAPAREAIAGRRVRPTGAAEVTAPP